MDDWDGEEQDEELTTDVADPATLRVRLMAKRCTTCIFRPGNLMHLEPGRLKGMVESCIASKSHVTCHDTLVYSDKGLPGAVCRGWEQHPDAHYALTIRYLKITGLVTLVDPETGELTDADYRTLPPPKD